MSEIVEQLEFPDFDKIIMHCKTIMSLKFPEYKNSWKDVDYDLGFFEGFNDNRFWQKRLQDEVNEFLKAKTTEDTRKELADIINVCCMIYEQVTYTRDPNWRYG